MSLVIYLVVRNDLKMGKGKIGAQCGHAIEDLIIKCPKPILHIYRRSGGTKICLRVNGFGEMEDLRIWCQENRIPHHQVIDAGRTQVKPGTETVLGIGPVLKEQISVVVKHMKLL